MLAGWLRSGSRRVSFGRRARAAALIVAALLGAVGVLGARAAELGFVPFWVQTFRPAHLWSGTDANAEDFGPVPQLSYFRVVTPQDGPRLHVYNPSTRDYAYLDASAAGPSGPALERLLMRRADGSAASISVELAVTDEAIWFGLMGRPSLPQDEGMLFILPRGVAYSFWMEHTYIPLSIAFIGQDLRILDVEDMQPLTEELHSPGVPYRYALETNQGWFTRAGVRSGDHLVPAPWMAS